LDQLIKAPDNGVFGGREKREYIRRFIKESVQLFGDHTVPVAIQDLQSSHVIMHDGAKFVDLELWRAGSPAEIDLLSMVNIFPCLEGNATLWHVVLQAYKVGRGGIHRRQSTINLYGLLSLAAKIYGCPNLV
jgi:hypothetical protein